MKKAILIFGILSYLAGMVQAQEKRALLIGINQYLTNNKFVSDDCPVVVPNLEGCVNDVEAMQAMIGTRFGFTEQMVTRLLNEQATRQGILNELQALIDKSKAGDIVLIYYSGHGTEVRNSFSREKRGMDEALIPVDYWKDKSFNPLRDKTLAVYFHKLVDKGVKLTAIFDCCHSGSLSRGPNRSTGRSRSVLLPEELFDAKDSSILPAPETQTENFAILSAAQNFEEAKEDLSPDAPTQGIFTRSLIEALSRQSVNASLESIFSATRAIIKAKQFVQEPVLGAMDSRRQQNLLGIQQGILKDVIQVPVMDTAASRIGIQAGIGIGMEKGAELALFSDKGDTICKYKVDTIEGISLSHATRISGNSSQVAPGVMLRLTRNAPAPLMPLRIFLPPSQMSDQAVQQFVSGMQKLPIEKLKGMKLVQVNGLSFPPDPYLSVFWYGDSCYSKTDRNPPRLYKNASLETIIANEGKKDSTLYVELPLSKATVALIKQRLQSNPSIELVDDPARAQYMVFGRMGKNKLPAYGFRKINFVTADTSGMLPLMTDCFELSAVSSQRNIYDSLYQRADQLYRLYRLLNLSVSGTTPDIPFEMVLTGSDDKMPLKLTGHPYGNKFDISLKQNRSFSRSDDDPDHLYCYLFYLDKTGQVQLLLPGAMGNVDNTADVPDPSAINDRLNPLLTDIRLTEAGTYTFFLVMSRDAISDYNRVFNYKAVNSGEWSRGDADTNPLADVLGLTPPGRGNTRGQAPRNYIFQRVSVTVVK